MIMQPIAALVTYVNCTESGKSIHRPTIKYIVSVQYLHSSQSQYTAKDYNAACIFRSIKWR